MNIKLRYLKVSDAEDFFRILNNPRFKFFSARPKTIREEENWIKECPKKRRKGLEYNFAIILYGELVGGAGIKVDQHRKHCVEIGYFVDEEHWGKGVATKVVKMLEDIAFNKLKAVRIEILAHPKNKASLRVAEKNGYKKEGIHKAKAIGRAGGYEPAVVLAKVKLPK
ncbi:GNAT family N-acetyltransferase [Candidatus Woesearchaeota archaeon]|nr:GNAT family N-acetyltransferase [Candidatus Woesearchaeota archaeon]